MNSLLARYLDGELDESEAREFLAALDRDPVLARELRQTERMLAVAGQMDDVSTPPSFVDAVMDRVANDGATDERTTPGKAAAAAATDSAGGIPIGAWLRPLATAAVLALVFVGGLEVGRAPMESNGGLALRTDDPSVENATAVVSTTPGLHVVRLVYVPTGGFDPERVTVAGDFNGWDGGATPLRRVGDVWTTTLRLPAGEYEYQFVENGDRWVTDPLALRQRTDGFGGRNAVLDVGV